MRRDFTVIAICAFVTLTGCSSGTSSSTQSTSPTPQPPVANAGGPYSGTAGVSISFSGSGSTDPQGQTLTYAWNFGDSTTGTGVSPSHTYSAAGTYTVSLAVSDTSNLTGTATSKATIAVAPLPPVANASGPYTGTVGAAVSFSGSSSSDPQGQTLSYAWNFGDSTTGTGVSPSHTYSAVGTYTVSLTVTDTSNLTATVTSKATIVGPPVANAGGPYTGIAGNAVSFSGSGSTDPQGQTLTYAWNFGDSTTGTGVSPTHTYSGAGTYTVSLTVKDTSNLTATTSTSAGIGSIGPALTGTVYSGNQTISGAHVYLFAANTTGYGQPSVSLLNAAATGHSDSNGAYVPTSSNGSFTLTADYTCTPGAQLYVYTLGGTVGSFSNSAAGLLAAIGSCSLLGNSNVFVVNEVSTVAAAYALAGFATDATHISSSGTALATVGVANAFSNAGNLAVPATGVAVLRPIPGSSALSPQSQVNTIADILNACVNSSGPSSSACSILFANAKSFGASGTLPVDTATAAINIAHNPFANIAGLFSLQSAASPFTPAISVARDFTMLVQFTPTPPGVGTPMDFPLTLAIDGAGNIWVTNNDSQCYGNGVFKFSSAGVLLSPAIGYKVGVSSPMGVAIDSSNNAWVTNGILDGVGCGTSPGRYLAEVSNAGVLLSPVTGYTGGGLTGAYTSNYVPDIAIDGNDNVWVTNANETTNSSAISKFSNAGVPLSPGSGYFGGGINGAYGIAVDASENIWVANAGLGANSVSKFSNTGVAISSSSGYTGGGLAGPNGIAIDASGGIWVANADSGFPLTTTVADGLTELSSSGLPVSPSSGIGAGRPYAVAVDGSGNIWTTDIKEIKSSTAPSSAGTVVSYRDLGPITSIAVDGSGNVWAIGSATLIQFVGAATPVVTPLAVGVKNNTLGSRP